MGRKLPELYCLATKQEIVISLVAAVWGKFIHGCNGNQYLESKRLTNFG